MIIQIITKQALIAINQLFDDKSEKNFDCAYFFKAHEESGLMQGIEKLIIGSQAFDF